MEFVIEYSSIFGLLMIICITYLIRKFYLKRYDKLITSIGKNNDSNQTFIPREQLSALELIESYSQLLPNQYQTSLEGYKLLTKSWQNDCKLTQQGRVYCQKECESNMKNLIGIYQQMVENPDMQNIEIKHPVFIVSWLRTGSTLLHNLVAVDPRNIVPYLWELLYPLPFSADIQQDVKVRKASAHQEMEDFYGNGFEDFRCIHELRAEFPDECCHIFERCFASRHLPIMGQSMQEYTDWFLNLSSNQIDNIYALYKSELQYRTYCKRNYEVEQPRQAQQWFLKDETHMYFLENLLKTFPDAKIVNLHRDPINVLGSTISGFYIIMKVYYLKANIDGKELARRCLEQMHICKERLLDVRSRVKELTGREESEVFIDIKFDDLCLDPKNVVMDLYNKLGKVSTDTHLMEMITYLLNNPRYKHGKNTYNIEDFGLTLPEVRKKFSNYIEKFLSS